MGRFFCRRSVFVQSQGRKPLRSGRKRPLKIGKFDSVAEAFEFTDHSGRASLIRLLANRRAPLRVADSLVKYLPDETAKPMGNHSDRWPGPQARQVAAIESWPGDTRQVSTCVNSPAGSSKHHPSDDNPLRAESSWAMEKGGLYDPLAQNHAGGTPAS
jgi:hypothetical protein